MKYTVISSSSKGNCTLISSKQTNILIDFGCSRKKVIRGLKYANILPSDFNENSRTLDPFKDISALLITHSHIDHIANIKYINQDKYVCSPLVLDTALKSNQYLEFYIPYKIFDLTIIPLPLSHDKPNTTGFLIKDDHSSLVYITDTGYIKDKVLDLIKDANYYIFESNHDTKMLYTSNRDALLISRIHSDKGHLDNIASATYLADLIGPHTKEITLAHLSEECNSPEVALETLHKVFLDKLGEIPSNIKIRTADTPEEFTQGGDLWKSLLY